MTRAGYAMGFIGDVQGPCGRGMATFGVIRYSVDLHVIFLENRLVFLFDLYEKFENMMCGDCWEYRQCINVPVLGVCTIYQTNKTN